MKDRRQSHTAEEEDDYVVRKNTETLLRSVGAYNYEASPLFKTVKPSDPTRVFASPEEIAKSKGYTIETQEYDMDKNDLVEGFWRDLFSAKTGDSISSWGSGELRRAKHDLNPRTGKPYYNRELQATTKRAGHVFGNLGSGALMDPDIPALLRNRSIDAISTFALKDTPAEARTRSGEIGKIRMDPTKKTSEANAFLRSQNVTNYGNPNYGKVRTVHPGSKSRMSLKVEKPDTVSDETKADALRRAEIYRTGSYKSLRGESIEQTEARILSEIKMNVKGGPMVGDTTDHLISGVKDAIEDKVVESFIQDLNEVDGAMGAYVSGPTTAPPKAVDPAEKIFNAHVNTGSVQIPFKSQEAERIKTSVDTPTLLRKAITGDSKAQASIEKGEKSMRPESKWIDPQHKMSSVELAKKGYMDFTGKR